MSNIKKRRLWQRQFEKIGVVLVICLSVFYSIRPADGFSGSFKLSRSDEVVQCEWSDVQKIVAVGDLHGAYQYFKDILIGTDLVDRSLHWIGGQAHLVQIGDVMDRGDGAKEILDLIMDLEKEAEAAGGHVHMLIGNHEEMNLANEAFDRPGYVTAGQFRDFLPEDYVLSREKRFSRRAGIYPDADDSENPDYTTFWEELLAKGIGNIDYAPRKQYYRNFIDMYGHWLLRKNIAIKINDIVFVHGGVSETFSVRTLKDINSRYRIEIEDVVSAMMRAQLPNIPEYDREIYRNPNGPLWYRELASPTSQEFEDDVNRILTNLKAGHMVIAHTPSTAVGEEQMKRYNGRIWIIDTGIADYYRPIGGHVSALIIENEKFRVWYPQTDKSATEVSRVAPMAASELFYSRFHPDFHLSKAVVDQHENNGGN